MGFFESFLVAFALSGKETVIWMSGRSAAEAGSAMVFAALGAARARARSGDLISVSSTRECLSGAMVGLWDCEVKVKS